MDESERASTAAPAPLGEVKQSVHSDLQYVSLQVDGKTYGGWYRLLTDGQMELLALANMHSERRFESTPIEQARGMLADFIRVARPTPKTDESAPVDATNGLSARTDEDRRDCTTGTLGALLYADKAKTRVSERDWVELVQSIAAGDQLALRELYERTHRIVFTLIMRLTNNRETADELTLAVFHDVWRQAPQYDAAGGSVVGWIMNQARSRAIDPRAINPLAFEQKKKRVDSHADSPLPMNAKHGSDEVCYAGEQGRLALHVATQTGDGVVSPATRQWTEPEWDEVAPGISCKLLATDTEKDRVSMLVRLAPGVEYPSHRHAGVEELHLLHGELLIDDRKLYPGDYNRAEPGSADRCVWSETGCMCVLITSTRDVLADC